MYRPPPLAHVAPPAARHFTHSIVSSASIPVTSFIGGGERGVHCWFNLLPLYLLGPDTQRLDSVHALNMSPALAHDQQI